MKKNIWSYDKVKIFLNLLGDRKPAFYGNNKTKARRRLLVKLYFRENRPENGYKRYTVRRSKPYHTWNSEEIPEESKHFWKEMQ